MRRDQHIYRSIYTVGILCLAVGVFGITQLAIVAIPLFFAGAALHWRWHRQYSAPPIDVGIDLGHPRTMGRPGLYDRHEGVVTSLTHWVD